MNYPPARRHFVVVSTAAGAATLYPPADAAAALTVQRDRLQMVGGAVMIARDLASTR
jgi:hypothetical protein